MLSQFSHKTRSGQLEKLDCSEWDVIIIGGGISGAGIALESTRMGWKTLLLEKDDFSSGTSSRSSGMIHGGLRYLEYGQFRLVREALKERFFLNNTASEIVKSNQFLFPVYEESRPFWYIRLGVWLYDILAGKWNIDKHQSLSKEQTLKLVPQLKQDGLKGGILYSDCLVRDSELVLSVILTAFKNGAIALNYVQAETPVKKSGKWQLNWKDTLSKRSGSISGKCIVTCTGVWTDDYLNHAKKRIRPTKGIHIAIPFSKCPLPFSVVLPSKDGRILFANQRGDHLYIGTTDTDFSGDPEDVKADENDINYILDKLNSLFPEACIIREDIHSMWAGLRPLVQDDGNPANLSRRDVIDYSGNGLVKVYGGKLTTFRKMAIRVSEKLKTRLRPSKPKFDYDSLTIDQAIFDSGNLKEDIVNYINYTMPMTLIDLLDRRMDLTRFGMDNGKKLASSAAIIIKEKLALDNNHIEEQVNAYNDHLNSVISKG